MAPKNAPANNPKKSKAIKREALKTKKSGCKIMNTESSNSKSFGIKKTRGPRYVWLPQNSRRSQGTIFVPSTSDIMNTEVSGIKKTRGPRYVWLPRDPRLHGDIFVSSMSEIRNIASNSKISGTTKTGSTEAPSKKSKNAKPEASKSKKISGVMSCRGSMFAPSRSEVMNTEAPNSSVSKIKKTGGAKTPRGKSKNTKPEASKSKKISGIMSCRGSMCAPSRYKIMNTKAPNSTVSEIKKTRSTKTPSKKSKNVKSETSESKKIVGVRKGARRTARMKI